MKQQEIDQLLTEISADCVALGRDVRFMEVCGTHTLSLFRSGLKSLLPENLRLISGPGCPVCVTSQGYIDAACDAAMLPDVTICTYGDMVRVPGRNGSLAPSDAGRRLKGDGAVSGTRRLWRQCYCGSPQVIPPSTRSQTQPDEAGRPRFCGPSAAGPEPCWSPASAAACARRRR